MDYIHDELVKIRPAGSAIQDEVSVTSPEMGKHQAEDKRQGEHRKGMAENRNSAENDRPGLLPTDEYFKLNVREWLKCDSCGFRR